MDQNTITQVKLFNPWLEGRGEIVSSTMNYRPRTQLNMLLKTEWDSLVTLLVGPRQAGKTTLGKYLAQSLIQTGRFTQLLYLNCDSPLIRNWLTGIHILEDISEVFELNGYILFIDEVQRLENPGLFLKAMIDLKLPIKIIASGSSYIEIQSRVQEFLTGRHFEATILPFSYAELGKMSLLERYLNYGCYPQVTQSTEQKRLLMLLYQTYINKDIVEILKIGMPAILEKLMVLIAHSSGQLINLNKFSVDCQVSVTTIRHYFDVLQKTYVIATVNPFVGNKRVEIKSAKKCCFLDNGFRNQALGNFQSIAERYDKGLLVESAVFQEIYKYKKQHFLDYEIYYWRTKNGAEVDFVLRCDDGQIYPVEVKYQPMKSANISRSYHSFIDAYRPTKGAIITLAYAGEVKLENTIVRFIPVRKMHQLFKWLEL